MMRAPLQQRAARGFTLVEAIVVIVITGILGGIVALFIRLPMQNYVDSAGRAELTDIADSALRRMTREIRLAVPNTVRVSGSSLEFMPSKTGGRYLDASDAVAGGNILSFEDASKLSFYVVGQMPVGKQTIVPGDYVVTFNLGQDFTGADVYANPAGNRAVVGSVNLASKLVTMTSNPFSLSAAHPLYRFKIASQPVSFVCSGGSLLRYSNYGFNPTQVALPTAATVTTLATNVSSCSFSYVALANTRTLLVGLTVVVQRGGGTDGPLALTQQVHVDNTP